MKIPTRCSFTKICQKGLIALLLSPAALAQINVVDSIEMRFENPTGFIASGEFEQLFVRVTNPADSGIVLEDFLSYTRAGSQYTTLTMQQSVVAYQSSDLCEGSTPCVVEGDFPLQPGESLLMAYQRLHAALGNEEEYIPPGSVIGIGALRFAFETEQETVHVYAENMPVYLVSEDGTGDPAVFDDYMVDLPPLVIPEVAISLIYPPSLLAGSNFHLAAAITNQEEFTLSSISTLTTTVPGGTPEQSFFFNRCQSNCYYTGGPELASGESTIFGIGNFYYDDDILRGFDFVIDDIRVSLRDPYGRTFEASAGIPSVHIEVIAPAGGDVENPFVKLPERVPFEYTSLISDNDYLLVHDPNTGYDWIKLDATINFTVEEMRELLASQPALTGFEFARISQVEELILNYIHASGVPAAYYQLRNSDNLLNQFMYYFSNAIGRTGGPYIASQETGGVVANKPHINDNWTTPVTIVYLRATNTGVPYSLSGYGLKQRAQDASEKDQQSIGFWLVRTNEAPIVVPDGARFYKEELILPRVKIDNAFYSLSMNFRNEVALLMQLTEIGVATEPGPGQDAEFNVATGILEIPDLAVHTGVESFSSVHLQLQYIEGTVTPTFLITYVEAN